MGDGMDRNMPEYEQMRSLKIFSDEEILKIKKTRENFEYKITQPSRVIKDYVEYIKYERGLIATTKERIKQQKINTSHSIIMQIADRMKKLYAQALSKFTNNIRFWDEYVKFLQTFKYIKDISPTFERMLQFHSDKVDVWIRAILWEFKENFNDERVKRLLLRAQQRHPTSEKLYLTFFQIELENKCQSDELEALQHADVVYSSSKKKFTNIDFYIEMLNIVDKFKYASSIQQTILEDMRVMFPREEILWHKLAQRELNGLSTVDSTMDFSGVIKTEGGECNGEDSKEGLKKLKIENLSAPPQHTLRKRIELSTCIYEEAVKQIDTKKMWNYYIEAMMELNSDLSTQPVLKRYALRRAFEGANESNHMSEDHYLQYIHQLITNNPQDEAIEKVFQKATKMYENSLAIWLLCLRYYIQNENGFSKVQENFRKAKIVLGPRGAEVWELYLIYLKTNCTKAEIQREFKAFILELSLLKYATFNQLKAQVLELVATTAKMKRAREVYEKFIKDHPDGYEYHDMMATLEAKQMKRDVEKERECMDKLIEHFGKSRADVWLRYMRFERNAGEPKNVSKLHKTALATLNPELLDDFSAQYNFFSNGVV
ncbi:U3 small nucleolar RNA-associated protein 6 homolog [Contarinia nasturtii]|uniref:U3 small nucleolar RNA-associated protein 6 homolog n=1 Tax=Contarinia nasturtii TaxID=265458 RepID=UPI0012D3E8C7|nr:U3 small nucleolar RNA-associated protein 6 homolog [Contarinia nasturtii]